MRNEWVSMSASALVTGAMTLLLGSLLNPTSGATDPTETLHVVQENSARWMAVAVLFFIASVALTLGLPAVLTLFTRRGRSLGYLAVGVFSIGTIGTSGYAMLMVFFRALVDEEALRPGLLAAVTQDSGFLAFIYVWAGCFYLGLLLLAFALFAAKRTPAWIPVLLLVFVAMFPVSTSTGLVGMAVQLMLLAVAFTGVAISATTPRESERLSDANV